MISSPFKWVGGKKQLLTELAPRIPKNFKEYLEPFCGAAALFFWLRSNGYSGGVLLGDLNKELITALNEIKSDVESLIGTLETPPFTDTSEEMFYAIRATEGSTASNYVAARFLYLNRIGYNGLYRVNKKGKFNVPYGRYTNPNVCNRDKLRAAAQALRHPLTSVLAQPFSETVLTAQKNDFVYFDPPYWPVSETAKFTSFTSGGFGEASQLELADTARMLRDKGVYVMLSNADVPAVRELYKDFHMDSVWARRSVNSDGTKRRGVPELIIRSYQ